MHVYVATYVVVHACVLILLYCYVYASLVLVGGRAVLVYTTVVLYYYVCVSLILVGDSTARCRRCWYSTVLLYYYVYVSLILVGGRTARCRRCSPRTERWWPARRRAPRSSGPQTN